MSLLTPLKDGGSNPPRFTKGDCFVVSLLAMTPRDAGLVVRARS